MGAISENLFESEMFGHKKGAFTDAKESRIGRFELAKNGTLFLDEIANIPLSQQAKLLRVLESGEYEVLGSSKTEHTHIRIISASNSDFSQLIVKEQFREDLFYRLNTLEFRVPSLKERQQDIIPLAEHFITLYSKKYHSENSQSAFRLCSSTHPVLKDYHWPGNIRELSHLIERAVLLAKNNLLKIKDLNLSQEISRSSHQTSANASRHSLAENSPEMLTGMTLAEAEQFLIQQALKQTENNIPKAAVLLGLTKSSMYRRIEKYES
jgi:DNA-binding NtrC family response regulator